jgi:hypothetical protein
MIRGYCHTNIDGITCNVVDFVSVPRIGDYVEVISRDNRNYFTSLKVCKITHKINSGNGQPYIEVELTK